MPRFLVSKSPHMTCAMALLLNAVVNAVVIALTTVVVTVVLNVVMTVVNGTASAVELLEKEPTVTVFENVNVLTMTDDGLITNATVVVVNDRIDRISESPIEAIDSALIIDGAGKTLMPGLADMHVHHGSEAQGALYLANSVTTVRNMWGSGATMVLDEGAKRGFYPGPHVYTPGPLMDGPEPIWGRGSAMLTSPEQAVGAVESQRTTGYKAVKLYEGLTPEIYQAAVQAAKDRDMQIYTHVPAAMTIQEVLALQVDSIEHFDGVVDAVTAVPDATTPMARWAQVDARRMAELVALSLDTGVWHSPTFSVIAWRYQYADDPDAFFELPGAEYIEPGLAEWWRGSARYLAPFNATKQQATANQREFARLLYEAGVPMLIGTDTPNPFVIPGYAIHNELQSFIDVGIPAHEVLEMATAGAARFLREDGEWGVVQAGARADLILLEADPRSDLSTLRRPVGVMVNGHWYSSALIRSHLDNYRQQIESNTVSANQ